MRTTVKSLTHSTRLCSHFYNDLNNVISNERKMYALIWHTCNIQNFLSHFFGGGRGINSRDFWWAKAFCLFYSRRFLPIAVSPYLMNSWQEHGHLSLFFMPQLSKTYFLVNERGEKKCMASLAAQSVSLLPVFSDSCLSTWSPLLASEINKCKYLLKEKGFKWVTTRFTRFRIF